MRLRAPRLLPLLLAGLALASACGRERAAPEVPAADGTTAERRAGSPNARPEIERDLRADRDAVRHPGDGGGRAWLEPWDGEAPAARVGRTGHFRLVYEAGPHGVAVGGSIQVQVSPFWGWSTPQTTEPEGPGYTEVTTDADGVVLEPRTLDRQLLGVQVGGRALRAGERVVVRYGAGPARADVDLFAEARSPFSVAVDADGDGVRAFLPEPPSVPVAAGPPAQLLLTLPSVVRPGEPVRLLAAVLDAAGSTGVEIAGTVRLEPLPEFLEGSRDLALGEGGRAEATLRATGPGVARLRAHGPGGLSAESNPLLVSESTPHVRWGDLHGHSVYSDGTGTPEDYFRYARDVAGLDVIALTDHDHWGLPFLDASPERFEEIRRLVRRYHAPGRFVTLLGYEWTSWVYGHRHVLYFSDEGSVVSSLDEATDTPSELWAALRGRPVMTVAHHSAGGPVATDWSFAPPPELEPVTEVASVHGNSESPDAPVPIRGAIPGNWVPDALARGYRLGFVGSGDSHDGHPGLAQLASGTGGLAAILSDDLSREGVRRALLARRTYATNGPRIVLGVRLDGRPMGSVLPAGKEHRLEVAVLGTAAIRRVDVLADGARVSQTDGEGRRELAFQGDVGPSEPGSFLYVRVIQQDGGAAWSSPFFFDTAGAAEAAEQGAPPAPASGGAP